jgi:hypothetical protein
VQKQATETPNRVRSKGKVLVIGPIVKTFGGISRFQEELLDSGIRFDLVYFNTTRPPKVVSRPVHRYDEGR